MGHVYVWRGGNGTLSVAANWADLATGTIALATPGTADSATLEGAASGLVLGSGTLDVGSLLVGGGVAFNGAVTAGTLADTGTLAVEGGATLHAATMTLAGTLLVDPESAVSIGGAGTAAGRLAVAAGAMLAGSGALHVDGGSIAVAGTIAAAGGALALFGTVGGSGTLAIGAGATLEAFGAVAAGPTVAFATPTAGVGGTLELFTAAASFGATLSGFAAGDAIDIASDSIESAIWANGVLTLTDAAGTALALALPDSPGQSYDAASFLPLPDGFGGTRILLAPPGVSQPSGNLTFTVAAGSVVLLTGTPDAVSQVVVGGILIAENQHLGTNNIAVAATGTLAAAGAGGYVSSPTATVSGLLIAVGAHATATVRGSLQLAGTFAAAGGGWASAYGIALAGGVLTLDAASGMTVGTAAEQAGALAVTAGATLAGWGTIDGVVADAGLIQAQGGPLALFGAVGGSGTLAIGAAATLEAFGALALPVQFGVGATLELFGVPSLVTGTLSGFAAGDALDVVGLAADSAAWANGTLSLKEGGATAGTLAMAGAYTGRLWQAQPDGAGGTVISVQPASSGLVIVNTPCFAAGTRIATPGGDVPVERLQPGDLVLTPAGPRPLRWVGRRCCDARAAPEARPVRIAAGALAPLLGATLPGRDLLLSPQHALLLRGMLVPAVALVGATGIRRETADAVTYHHLGLDSHATVLAEGVPAESYLPLDAAARFDTEAGERPPPAASCAPRLEGGADLAALRCRLPRPRATHAPPGGLRGHLERATDLGGTTRLEGWALDDGPHPVRLTVFRAGRRVGVAVANRWRPDLDRAGLAGGRCAFDLDLPGAATGVTLLRRPDGAALPPLTDAISCRTA